MNQPFTKLTDPSFSCSNETWIPTKRSHLKNPPDILHHDSDKKGMHIKLKIGDLLPRLYK